MLNDYQSDHLVHTSLIGFTPAVRLELLLTSPYWLLIAFYNRIRNTEKKRWIVTNNLTKENMPLFMKRLGGALHLLDPVDDIDFIVTNNDLINDSTD